MDILVDIKSGYFWYKVNIHDPENPLFQNFDFRNDFSELGHEHFSDQL